MTNVPKGPYRRFRVEILDLESALLRFTCTTCGHKTRKRHLVGPPRSKLARPMNPGLLKKWVAYANDGRGAIGHCRRCTKNLGKS